VAKRRRGIVTWKTFERYLLETYTVTGNPGTLYFGALRGFLMDDPRWGIDARPEVWPKLRRHIRMPAYQDDWSKEAVIESGLLIKQTLGPSGNTRKAARALIALWSPRGPLKIPRTLWIADPGFQDWLDTPRTK